MFLHIVHSVLKPPFKQYPHSMREQEKFTPSSWAVCVCVCMFVSCLVSSWKSNMIHLSHIKKIALVCTCCFRWKIFLCQNPSNIKSPHSLFVPALTLSFSLYLKLVCSVSEKKVPQYLPGIIPDNSKRTETIKNSSKHNTNGDAEKATGI